MKTIVVLLTLMMGTLAVQADNYTHLTFETTDGASISVEASSLTITISGTTLTAGNQSFTLSNLSKMYFTTADATTGIKAVSTLELDDATTVYDLNGRKVQKDQLKTGIYVIKTKNGNKKITVK